MTGTLRKLVNAACLAALIVPAVLLGGCGEISYAQKASPANPFKDYRAENANNASVLGIGEPISTRQMRANATFTLKGQYTVDQVLSQMATTYNVAIRWGNGVRKGKRTDVVINNLSFDEARAYVEDVYDIQIIREGDRRLLVLPSASEPRVANFKPGENVTLAQALRGLADQCGYNLVITENKEKIAGTRITTNLRDVTCYDAFEALLNPQGLSLVSNGDYFTVGGMPQRQWNVGLDEPVRAEELEVTYTSDFTSTSSGSNSSSSSSSSSGESGSSQSAGGTNKVTVKSERDLWKELQDNLQALIDNHCPDKDVVAPPAPEGGNSSTLLPPPTTLTTAPQNQAIGGDTGSSSAGASNGDTSGTANGAACGYVRINRAVGLVQMRAPKAVLDEADDIIGRVEDIASRRLFLEARVLAVSRSRGFEQGATLKLGKGEAYAGYTPTNSSITATLVGQLLNVTQGGGYAAVKNQSIDAALRLLENYGTTYELMHPQLELMDRQRATLIDGRNEQYFIPEPETETTTTGTVTNVKFDQRSQFIGLQFTASAQISNGDEPHTVSLQIPIVSIDKTVTLKQTINNQDYNTDVPVASTRLIDEKVRVRDGEIKVIGGLTKTIAIDKEAGQPLLREIPAVGKLLNDENVSFEEVEFVVLLQVRRLI